MTALRMLNIAAGASLTLFSVGVIITATGNALSTG